MYVCIDVCICKRLSDSYILYYFDYIGMYIVIEINMFSLSFCIYV